MLLGILGASLLRNVLTGGGVKTTCQGRVVNKAGKVWGQINRINRAGEGVLRVGYSNRNGFLMPPHPLTNFETQKYYQIEPRFNAVYSRGNLTEIKDGAYVINLHEHSDIGTHWLLCT